VNAAAPTHNPTLALSDSPAAMREELARLTESNVRSGLDLSNRLEAFKLHLSGRMPLTPAQLDLLFGGKGLPS